jgi:A/G-specific adenine glycosylase
MLQQTQVARVEERFEGFMARFPSPRSMVRAGEDAVLALWEGLGYYRRARLLHAAAVRIVERHGGDVPADAEALLDLPGVGRYTAGSVASIAFGLREPIVDGNVVRVVARLAAIDARADEPGLVEIAWRAAAELVNAADDPGGLNEGLMELGATVCTPANPRCDACPCRDRCRARAAGLADALPRPKVRPTRKVVHLDLVLMRSQGRLAFVQRSRGGLWGGLWQPPGIESETPPAEADRRRMLGELGVDVDGRELAEVATVRRLLTHREVHLRVHRLSGEVEPIGSTTSWHDRTGAAALGMAKPVRTLVDAHGW